MRDIVKKAVAKTVLDATQEALRKNEDPHFIKVTTQLTSELELLVKVDNTQGGPRWFKVKVSEMH